MSKQALLEKLSEKHYRDAFVSDEIDVGLPMQIRAMREARQLSQADVAVQTSTKQPRLSLMEKPGYGNFSLNTLKKLASFFDVGLIVSFVPYGEMINFVEGLSPKRLAVPGFSKEYPSLLRRFSRVVDDSDEVIGQAHFDFSATAQEHLASIAEEPTAINVSAASLTITTDCIGVYEAPELETEREFPAWMIAAASTTDAARID